MSENNNEQFKMPPKRPRGPMGRGPGMVTEKARDFKGSTKKLIKYLGRYWAAIIAVMIFAAVSTVFSVAGPKVMGKATTALAEGLMNKIAGTGGIDFDYIAKGLKEKKVLLVYGLKNAAPVILTAVGQSFGSLITGTIVTETIFNIPGLGTLTMNSINRRDVFVIQGVVLFVTLLYVLVNLAVDILYGFVDPRLQPGRK